MADFNNVAVGLRFTKMHGIGNDFVVLDARTATLSLDVACVRAMADRHTGIGFDQLLVIERPRDPACIAAYLIYNADGSRAQQCGNGARCIAAWLHRDGVLDTGAEAKLESPADVIGVRLLDARTVAVEMGQPEFDPAQVPFNAPTAATTYPLDVADERIDIAAVSIGNPHAVLEVDDIASARVDQLGPRITAHPRFPEGANAGFVQVLDDRNIRLRVHERGAGWTLACGSGACAAVAALHQLGRIGEKVRVELPGGSLQITWRGLGHPLWMTGPATFVYDGKWLGA